VHGQLAQPRRQLPPCVAVLGGIWEIAFFGDGPRSRQTRRWDVVIWLRIAANGHSGREGDEAGANIVVDLHDPSWPGIRRVGDSLAGCRGWYVAETRAFGAGILPGGDAGPADGAYG
jgi:hypothetical protein